MAVTFSPNHQEFTNGSRVFLLDGSSGAGIQDHPTHVAGTMTAYGVNGTAIGFCKWARLVESYYTNDLAEMPLWRQPITSANQIIVMVTPPDGWPSNLRRSLLIMSGLAIHHFQPSWIFGFYDGTAAFNTDLIIYKAQTYLPVFRLEIGTAIRRRHHNQCSTLTTSMQLLFSTAFIRQMAQWFQYVDHLCRFQK